MTIISMLRIASPLRLRAASGVDTLGDLVDVPADGGQGGVHLLDIRGVKLDDIPVYRHQAIPH